MAGEILSQHFRNSPNLKSRGSGVQGRLGEEEEEKRERNMEGTERGEFCHPKQAKPFKGGGGST